MQRATHYTANSKKPDHDRENILQLRSIFPDDTVNRDQVEELETYVKVEDSADSDRAEEANKQSLLLFFNLPDFPMQGEDNREPTEEQDENAEKDESIDRYNIVVCEAGPRADGTEPHKN